MHRQRSAIVREDTPVNRIPSFRGRAAWTVAVSLAVLLAAPTARAQTTGAAGATGTTTSLTTSDIFFGIQKTMGVNLTNFELQKYFNKSTCDCDADVFIRVALTTSGLAKRALVSTAAKFEVWMGTSCEDPVQRAQKCYPLPGGSVSLGTFLSEGMFTIKTSAKKLETDTANLTGGFVATPDCTSARQSFNQTIYALADADGDGAFDPSPAQTEIFVDLGAPPAPSNIKVTPGNEALNIAWTDLDFATNQDLQGYQILCRRGADLQVFPDNTYTAYYQSCKATRQGSGLEGLDPLFACSPLLGRSTTSYRVKILQNGIPYAATVVAIDNNGNASPPTLVNVMGGPTNFATPEPTQSFYGSYRGGDATNGSNTPPGAATGGFCTVGGPAPPGPWAVAGGALAVAMGLAGCRRRRRR